MPVTSTGSEPRRRLARAARPGRRLPASAPILVALAAILTRVWADGPPIADPFQRCAAGDAPGTLAALVDAYRGGKIDVRAARLYQDLRLEAGERAALVEETRAAFPEPRSIFGQYLLARIVPRKELDAAIQRLLPSLAEPGYGLLDQAWAAIGSDNVPHATALLPRVKKLVGDFEETVLFEARLLDTTGDRVGAERVLAAWCASHADAVDARKAWIEELLALRRVGDAAAAAEQGLGRVRAPAFLAARASVALAALDTKAAKALLDEAKDGGRPAVRAEVKALRAATALAARDVKVAQAEAEAGVAISPVSVPALRALARALEVAGKHAEALERLDAALDLRPGFAPLLADRGLVLHALGQDREAKRALAEARKKDPGHLDALLYQGVLAEDDGDWVGAEKAYRALLKIDSEHVEAHRMLGGVLFSMGKIEPAGAEAAWIEERFPLDANAWFLTGRVELKSDRFDEALAAFDKSVACDSKYALGHMGRGWVLEEQARPDDAKKAYGAAIAADPDLAIPHRYLAELFEEQGNQPEAAKHYKAYLDLGGADPDEDVKHAVERLSK